MVGTGVRVLFILLLLGVSGVYLFNRPIRAKYPGLPWMVSGTLLLLLAGTLPQLLSSLGAAGLIIFAMLLIWWGVRLDLRAKRAKS